MNIFFRELKAHRNSLIGWAIGIFFMVASGMAKFAAMGNDAKGMNDLIQAMPKAVQSVLGFGSFDTTKAIGYYGMLFIYLAVMATIHATMIGAEIFSKEERDKTTEFLFVKPVSRTRIITEKLLAAFVNIVIFNVITVISSFAVVNKYAKGEPITHDIMILMAGMFMLQILFLSIGSGIAAMNKNPRIPTSIATVILLFTFILSIAIDVNNKIIGLRWLTPFKYFDAKDLMNNGRLDPVYVTISILIIGTMITSTYIFYKKRDLNV